MSRRITQWVTCLAAVMLVCLCSPAQASLILGLDSHDIVQAGGTPISAWTGVGSAAQGTAANQPTFLAAAASLGGHPAVSLDDVDDGMTTTAVGIGSTYTVMTLYAYRKTNTDPARVLQGKVSNWLIGPWSGQHQFLDGAAFINSFSSTTDPVILTASSSAAPNEFHFNGALVGSKVGGTAIGELAIGTAGKFAETADSDLGAVLVFDQRLSHDERVGVEHFLAAAFELQGFDATAGQQAAGIAVLDGFLTVPEPGSMTLFVLGISGLLAVGFRRRRRAVR